MDSTDLCTYLEWDSNFFGVRIARANHDSLSEKDARLIDNWCYENRIDCLYYLARSDNASVTRTAEAFGYALVDMRVTLLRDSLKGGVLEPAQQKGKIRLYQPGDLAYLREIARYSHTDSRFYFDGNFPWHLCDSLYETWLQRSCEGNADTVFVATLDGVPSGYFICRLVGANNDHGNFNLLGLARHARQLGVGQALVASGLRWFEERGIHRISIATQGRNIGSQRLFQKQGFRTSSLMLWYHKWYSRGPELIDYRYSA